MTAAGAEWPRGVTPRWDAAITPQTSDPTEPSYVVEERPDGTRALTRVCGIDGCLRLHHARNRCAMHHRDGR